MARQKVEQVKCDRCKRVELQPVQEGQKADPDFVANLKGRKLVFFDLCIKCEGTISNLWDRMAEWERDGLPLVSVGPVVGPNQAATLSPAPNYTPPQPHSAAGAKRS